MRDIISLVSTAAILGLITVGADRLAERLDDFTHRKLNPESLDSNNLL